MNSLEYRQLNGIDGEPVEFEWTFVQDTQDGREQDPT